MASKYLQMSPFPINAFVVPFRIYLPQDVYIVWEKMTRSDVLNVWGVSSTWCKVGGLPVKVRSVTTSLVGVTTPPQLPFCKAIYKGPITPPRSHMGPPCGFKPFSMFTRMWKPSNLTMICFFWLGVFPPPRKWPLDEMMVSKNTFQVRKDG